MTEISLRQHRILLLLLNTHTFLTGEEISEKLGVTSRTVRNDIAGLNNALERSNIQISSMPGHGYFLPKECYPNVQEILKGHQVFFDRADRIRYITIRLCLSETSLDTYDLEEELSVSRTTLVGDIQALKEACVFAFPNIALHYKGHTIEFEQNEYKRREILGRLMWEFWDYNSSGNAYYGQEFIEPSLLHTIMETSRNIYHKHHISLEDPSFIAISLSIAIAYYRIGTGHELEFHSSNDYYDEPAMTASEDLLNVLEDTLNTVFPKAERLDVYHKISSCRIRSLENIEDSSLSSDFSLKAKKIADDYLSSIHSSFGLDLSPVKEFYCALLRYIENLQKPYRYLDPIDSLDIKRKFLYESEYAVLFQKIYAAHTGRIITDKETAYLTYLIMGGLNLYYKYNPEERIKTILLSSLNQSVTWALEQRLKSYFSQFLEFVPSISLYETDHYDFTGIDLVLCTARKKIEKAENNTVLYCSPLLSQDDHMTIESFIRNSVSEKLYPLKDIPFIQLLREGYRHDGMHFLHPREAIEFMLNDFLNDGLATPNHLFDILQNDASSSFAIKSGVVLVYSLLPSGMTRFSVMTLADRIQWGSQSIRVIIMASFSSDDIRMIFPLKRLIYEKYYDADKIRQIKTVEEYMDHCRIIEIPAKTK